MNTLVSDVHMIAFVYFYQNVSGYDAQAQIHAWSCSS